MTPERRSVLSRGLVSSLLWWVTARYSSAAGRPAGQQCPRPQPWSARSATSCTLLPTTSWRCVCVAAVCCPRGTWRCVLRRYLALQLSAEIKADLMAVLEAYKPGPCVVNVLWRGHSNIQLPWTASQQWFSRTHGAAPTTFMGRVRAMGSCSDRAWTAGVPLACMNRWCTAGTGAPCWYRPCIVG